MVDECRHANETMNESVSDVHSHNYSQVNAQNDQNTLTFIIPPSHIESLDGVNTGHIQCPVGYFVRLSGVEAAGQFAIWSFSIHYVAGVAA